MNVWPNRLVAAALAALTAAACGGSGPQVPTERSNLVLVTVSSLRADHLGIYGYPRNISPNLDLFGASGAVFLEALTPWPETGRAAAALLTGVDPSRSTRGEPARLVEGATLDDPVARARLSDPRRCQSSRARRRTRLRNRFRRVPGALGRRGRRHRAGAGLRDRRRWEPPPRTPRRSSGSTSPRRPGRTSRRKRT